MDAFLQNKEKTKGGNSVLYIAVGTAILIVLGLFAFWAARPAPEVKKLQHLEGAFLEGSPEFEAMTKKIPIQNDAENTLWSPTGLGSITMFPRCRIRNTSDKTITALEIRVSILDQFGKVIKDKTQIVLPNEKIESLPPNSDFSITVPVEGFNKNDDRARVQWKVTAVKVQ